MDDDMAKPKQDMTLDELAAEDAHIRNLLIGAAGGDELAVAVALLAIGRIRPAANELAETRGKP